MTTDVNPSWHKVLPCSFIIFSLKGIILPGKQEKQFGWQLFGKNSSGALRNNSGNFSAVYISHHPKWPDFQVLVSLNWLKCNLELAPKRSDLRTAVYVECISLRCVWVSKILCSVPAPLWEKARVKCVLPLKGFLLLLLCGVNCHWGTHFCFYVGNIKCEGFSFVLFSLLLVFFLSNTYIKYKSSIYDKKFKSFYLPHLKDFYKNF